MRGRSLPILAAALVAAPVPAQIRHEGCEDLASGQFRKVDVAVGDLQEPVKMAFLPDGRILVAERRGAVKVVKPGATAAVPAWTRKVFWERSLRNAKIEDGTLGIAVDPGFPSNHWIYVYYSPLEESVNRLSRFTLKGDLIDTLTEKVLLEVGVQRDFCCHTGGGLGFDALGNLYLSTGDNTASEDAYGAINERPDMAHRDAQRSSGNTDDLRGKVLRIRPKPLPDGAPAPAWGPGATYDIPAGNLKEAFASLWPDRADQDKVRPEIYSMGHRNPYTLSVDRYTGWAHVGEVGPDAGTSSEAKGPAKHEEFNIVRRAGNFGWPYFIGNNLPYKDFDYATGATGPAFDPAAPVNASANNTGVRNLPPASMAALSRETGKKGKTVDGLEQFAAVEGATAIGGPVYYYDGRNPNPHKLPPHFDRKWLMTDHGPGMLNIAAISPDGERVTGVSRVPLPGVAGAASPFDRPVGMEVGPDGMLYVIEYAAPNFSFTASTRISRIEYTGTCRPPVPVPPELPGILGGPGRHVRHLLPPLARGRAVHLPAAYGGFALHDLKGAAVWEYRRAGPGAAGDVHLPADLPAGVLKVRFLPR